MRVEGLPRQAAAVPSNAVTASPARPLLKRVVAGIDALAIAVGMVVAYVLRDHLPVKASSVASQRDDLLLGTVALPVWLVVFGHYKLYRARYIQSRVQEFKRVANGVAASILGTSFLGTMLKLDVTRSWLILSFPTCLATVVIGREAVRRVFRALRLRGHLRRKVAIIGSNLEAAALYQMLDSQRYLGYEVVGFIDDLPAAALPRHLPLLPRLADVVGAVRALGATGALIATSAVELETANRLARELSHAGIHVEMSSSLRDVAAERLTLRSLGRCPVVYVEPVRQGWRAMAKQLFDVAAAALGLVLASPALMLTAVAIKVDDPSGPVLFRQQRVGRNGRPFEVLKFRTMVVNAEQMKASLMSRNEAGGPLFKMRDDPRVTRVGRILRRFSIDELPQLWNVIKGEMSLVGPRPALPDEMELWDDRLRQRLRVRPGMTGMWQVNGRSASSFEDYVRLDLYYVDNWSFWSDLAIIAKTLPAVLSRSGAC